LICSSIGLVQSGQCECSLFDRVNATRLVSSVSLSFRRESNGGP